MMLSVSQNITVEKKYIWLSAAHTRGWGGGGGGGGGHSGSKSVGVRRLKFKMGPNKILIKQ